ncbi:MAG: hypothetical protein AB7S81_04870 [Bdellovibrionales bacterium]
MRIKKVVNRFILAGLLLCCVAACSRVAWKNSNGHTSFIGNKLSEGLSAEFVVDTLGAPKQYVLSPVVKDSVERDKNGWTAQDKKGRVLEYWLDQDGSSHLSVDLGQGHKLSYEENRTSAPSCGILTLSHEPESVLVGESKCDVPVAYKVNLAKGSMSEEVVQLGTGLGASFFKGTKYLSQADIKAIMTSVRHAMTYIEKHKVSWHCKRPNPELQKKNYPELRKS